MNLWPAWYRPNGSQIPACDVIAVVARMFETDVPTMRGAQRHHAIVNARSVAVMVLLGRGMSTSVVGRMMNRDHTSIIHLRDTFAMRARRFPKIDQAYSRIALERAA